ncbi:hypothetical protein [Clostridium aminobutyricum]|uniref:Uncharacterized protein n=1 Tax=Clostridium aminobutyricum TaxID=33953 RepID=A0A939IJ36_CLOAM|nr:hypothetical protein [Clostridium aminobutyricum]MBN7773159.1 hypothetical protein [Clostridium aminobutyricum]
MVVYENKGFETNNLFPNEDWTGKAKYIVKDSTELANKISAYAPSYDFVTDGNDTLIDIIPTEKPPEPTLTSVELREQAYETMLYRDEGVALIAWDNNSAITVDQANKKWLDYSAEGSTIANELSTLIVSAKAYIRELYQDE